MLSVVLPSVMDWVEGRESLCSLIWTMVRDRSLSPITWVDCFYNDAPWQHT